MLFELFSWLWRRSLFTVTDDWSPVQSIRLVLIFSQRREKKGWVLPCFCMTGAGLCQRRLQWPHLPLGTVAVSPRKELKSFSVPLQPVREAANLMGFPGGSDAFLSLLALTSLEQRWMGLAWWLPDGTQGDALGSACPAGPKCNWVTGEGSPGFVLSLLVGNLTPFVIQRERRELFSSVPLVIMGCFFFFFSDPVESWSCGVVC